ncbi:TVP38/TMEM64 family protein [Parvularcula sp. LCG005]|uniref:TVP38/TMEM64 family protein n=1 Tax=Parvularcula sp. LCG005 TaxID=3078805 RepID=UPI002942A216|nr:TVP38/TMEM64 family protein [Parvularcula sp. LCG005]WOI52063.1 TVP38/TMEM64 family protein [Parvularcula sp. LCG005]
MAEHNEGPKGGVSLAKLAPIGVIVVALAAFFGLGLQRYFDWPVLKETVAGFQAQIENNILLSVLVYLGIYAALVAISFPGATILTILSGFLFGQWWGTLAAWLGASLGATAIFLAVKTAFGDAISRRASGFIARMEKGFREDELSYMFLLRVVPVFPFFAVNIAAGALGVKLRNFALGTLVGILPGSFVYVSIGNAIRQGSATLDDAGIGAVFSEPAVFLPFVGLALLGLIPILIKRFGGKKARTLTESEPS